MRVAFISSGRLLGTMTPDEARLCGRWLHQNDMQRLADFFDQAANLGDEETQCALE